MFILNISIVFDQQEIFFSEFHSVPINFSGKIALKYYYEVTFKVDTFNMFGIDSYGTVFHFISKGKSTL